MADIIYTMGQFGYCPRGPLLPHKMYATMDVWIEGPLVLMHTRGVCGLSPPSQAMNYGYHFSYVNTNVEVVGGIHINPQLPHYHRIFHIHMSINIKFILYKDSMK